MSGSTFEFGIKVSRQVFKRLVTGGDIDTPQEIRTATRPISRGRVHVTTTDLKHSVEFDGSFFLEQLVVLPLNES